MQLDFGFELEDGEAIVAVLVRTNEGKYELRDVLPSLGRPLPAAPPQVYVLKSVVVFADETGDIDVEIKRDEESETLLPSQCVVPASWPRNVETAAEVYVGPAGSLVLDRVLCPKCLGTKRSSMSPKGFVSGFGAVCEWCRGVEEYLAAPSPSPSSVPPAGDVP